MRSAISSSTLITSGDTKHQASKHVVFSEDLEEVEPSTDDDAVSATTESSSTDEVPCRAACNGASGVGLLLFFGAICCMCHWIEGAGAVSIDTGCSDEDTDSCLRTVDKYLDNLPRHPQLGLLQTYGPMRGVLSPCPEFSRLGVCRFDIYDSSVSSIYYTKRGRFTEAQRILDGLIQVVYPTSKEQGGGELGPSKHCVMLVAAAFNEKPVEAGKFDDILDGAVDTGNNAWAAIAFAHFAAATGKSCYALVAYDILKVLATRGCAGAEVPGYSARPGQSFRSAEHNIDVYALANILNVTEVKKAAAAFVQHMFGFAAIESGRGVYAIGTSGGAPCNTNAYASATPCDAQFWNFLAGADREPARTRSAILQALDVAGAGMLGTDVDSIGNAEGKGKDTVYHGLRFTNWGKGVQWENTASAVMGLILYGERNAAEGPPALSNHVYEMRKSLKTMLDVYGAVLGSVLPEGTETGLRWKYFRAPHTASTAWTGLLLLFHANVGDTINHDANPLAPPSNMIPLAAASDTSCLPAEAPEIDGSSC